MRMTLEKSSTSGSTIGWPLMPSSSSSWNQFAGSLSSSESVSPSASEYEGLWLLGKRFRVGPRGIDEFFGRRNLHERPQSGFHLFSGKFFALGWKTLLASAFFGLLMSELVLCVGLLLDPGSFLERHPAGTARAGELRTLCNIRQ